MYISKAYERSELDDIDFITLSTDYYYRVCMTISIHEEYTSVASARVERFLINLGYIITRRAVRLLDARALILRSL